MKPKDLFIALLFLASTALVIFGGWNYMKGRINQFEETQKAEKLASQGYDAEEALQKIKKSKTNALIMFAVGFTGIFLIIKNASGKRGRINTTTKQTIKGN